MMSSNVHLGRPPQRTGGGFSCTIDTSLWSFSFTAEVESLRCKISSVTVGMHAFTPPSHGVTLYTLCFAKTDISSAPFCRDLSWSTSTMHSKGRMREEDSRDCNKELSGSEVYTRHLHINRTEKSYKVWR